MNFTIIVIKGVFSNKKTISSIHFPFPMIKNKKHIQLM
jgi:hypothetical protein